MRSLVGELMGLPDAPVIFMSAGFTSVSASLFLTGVFGVVKLLSAIAFMFVFVKIRGNRFWLLLGSSLCGICMLVLAYFVAKIPPVGQQGEAKLTLGGVVSVLTVYIFAFSFSVSLGPISWNVCSEVCQPILPRLQQADGKADLPVTYKFQMLCDYHLHTMAVSGAFSSTSNLFPNSTSKEETNH